VATPPPTHDYIPRVCNTPTEYSSLYENSRSSSPNEVLCYQLRKRKKCRSKSQQSKVRQSRKYENLACSLQSKVHTPDSPPSSPGRIRLIPHFDNQINLLSTNRLGSSLILPPPSPADDVTTMVSTIVYPLNVYPIIAHSHSHVTKSHSPSQISGAASPSLIHSSSPSKGLTPFPPSKHSQISSPAKCLSTNPTQTVGKVKPPPTEKYAIEAMYTETEIPDLIPIRVTANQENIEKVLKKLNLPY
jgi:hypothetical protein